MNRRGFLTALSAVVASPILPEVVEAATPEGEAELILYGQKIVLNDTLRLRSGRYYISTCKFSVGPEFPDGNPMVLVESGARGRLTNCFFSSEGTRRPSACLQLCDGNRMYAECFLGRGEPLLTDLWSPSNRFRLYNS